MTRSQVISSLISKYDSVVTGKDKSAIELAVFKIAICQLVDAAFSGGGGGGSTTATVSDGIDASIDINTIVNRLISIDNGKLTQSSIESAIQSAADIDTIIAKLTTIATNTDTSSTISTLINTYTHSNPSITDTGTVVLAINNNRKGAAIVNRSTNSVDLFFGTVGAYGTGLPLVSGQSYEINSTNLYTGVVRAITSSGNTVILTVAEGV